MGGLLLLEIPGVCLMVGVLINPTCLSGVGGISGGVLMRGGDYHVVLHRTPLRGLNSGQGERRGSQGRGV